MVEHEELICNGTPVFFADAVSNNGDSVPFVDEIIRNTGSNSTTQPDHYVLPAMSHQPSAKSKTHFIQPLAPKYISSIFRLPVAYRQVGWSQK